LTPQQIENAARRKYNSVGSSFYAQEEIWDLIYQAECEIAAEARILEFKATVSAEAIIPFTDLDNLHEITKVFMGAQRLHKIDMQQAEAMGFNVTDNTETTGTPQYYMDRTSAAGRALFLYPSSDTEVELDIFGVREPALVTSAAQVLETPSMFHHCIVDYVVAEMAAKDKQWDTSQKYFDKWYQKHLPSIIKWDRRRKSSDRFNIVKDEEIYFDPLWINR
jgi:hypothetical protein